MSEENRTEYPQLQLDSQLCFPLYACARKVIGAYTPLLKPLGLTYTQYIEMLELWEKEKVKVGERGQIVIPKEARDIFGMQPGDKLVVLGEDGKGIALCKEAVFIAGMTAAMSIMQRSVDEICQEKQDKKA